MTVMRALIKALNSGKHVFVEKPLALTFEQIEQVEQAYANGNFHLMVVLTDDFPLYLSK